jgi:hypothetical protein
MTATAETAARLQYVIDSWDHLTDMLDTRHGAPWPPAARMSDYLAGLEKAEATAEEIAEAAAYLRAGRRVAERADSRFTLGESPAPIRLAIVDTMRGITDQLVYLCDVLSQEVTRPPMKHAPSHWTHADRVKRDLMADRDSADPRRWHRRRARSAPDAAAWLLGRLRAEPGPFLPLGPSQLRRIEAAAGHAHKQIDRSLDGVRRAQVVDRPCPLCGGTLGMASGDGEAPIVACFGCRQEWTLPATEAA